MDEALRRQVWQRALGVCEYCRLPRDLDILPFQIDHVIAAKHHGATTFDNFALSCFACNAYFDCLTFGRVGCAHHNYVRSGGHSPPYMLCPFGKVKQSNYKGANLAGIDPETGDITPLFHARRDAWEQHFQWNGPELRGRSPIGRTTIDVLKINLPERVEHRRLLREAGVFPRGA